MLATAKGIPMMVMCTKRPDPAAWSIIGRMSSIHFLSYKDMEAYIAQHGLERWTDEYERKTGIHLCGAQARTPFIF